MFDRIVRCPNCGGGPDCKRTYFYDEVYKFSHVANIEEVENYNV